MKNKASVLAPIIHTAEPQCGYREDCDTGGQKHSALLGWRPAPEAAPNYGCDAGEPGRAANHAVRDTDRTVREYPGASLSLIHI